MHRTQIYLQDALFDDLKARARGVGVSVSELIRRTLEKDILKNPAADAKALFERMKPLKSFASVEPEAYVRSQRKHSRLVRDGAA